MQSDQIFRRASHRFQAKEYQQGLQLINKCIQQYPNNSTLYSNRAVCNWQLRHIELAEKDFINAIKYNHLNFQAYFNLFSLQISKGEIKNAFDNLCCSLSCLYLIEAKKSRNDVDINDSLKYASNNPETHILKALIYCQKQLYEQALNEIQTTITLKIHTQTCIQLKNTISAKINHYPLTQVPSQLKQAINFRLHTTYQPTLSYQQQIKIRVAEFNQLYQHIFNSQCIHQIPFAGIKTSNQIKIIKQAKKLQTQSPHKLQSQAATKQNLPNQDSILSLKQQGKIHQQTSINNFHEQQVKAFQKIQEIFSQHHSHLSQSKQNKSNISCISSTSEPIDLYPIKSRKKIQFTILEAVIVNPSQKMKDLYLIGHYRSQIGQQIKTPSRKLYNNSVEWFTSALPTAISSKIQKFDFSVYSKQYFAKFDELIGQGHIYVQTSGQVNCSIYLKGQIVGSVVIRIDTI